MRAIIFISLFALVVGNANKSVAQTTNYQVYALFVVNIAKYSEFPQLQGELEIASYGRSKAYDELIKQNGKTVNGHTLKVTQSDDIGALQKASVIYLADNKSSSLDEILKATEGRPVMIICEREGMFRKGAGLSFVVTDNNTLRFDVNNGELEKRQIKISKNLTALANTIL
ncbi:MAG TPA: YfiR family protein [Chryseolinea sp.]|nr:YfiR family protein [Chryseolinea sp.]